ncbi:MAG: nlhH 3 [Fibrobacteres bacterium]|nr:nlhH 3 [Fibrobacterota bacterium]
MRFGMLLMIGWIACAGSLRAQGSGASLSGTVRGPDGALLKDAKVILLGRDITVRTDAQGRYVFAGLSTSLASPAGGSARGAEAVGARYLPPGVFDGGMRFTFRDRVNGVRVFLVTLAGRMTLEVTDRDAAPSGVSPGPASAALRKTALAGDTLSVVAVGFERAERVVETLSGTQDFRLNVLEYVNIQYKTGPLTDAEKSSCILDVHMPKAGTAPAKGWPVVIHFHGGGLTGGDRNEAFTANNRFGQKFLDAGVMEIAPGYRLIRHGGTWPDYIRDAARASIWVRKNIESYGGDPNSVFITGFSAGAYLTHMLAVDSTWFAEAKFDPRRFAGFVSLSGQTRVHDSLQMDLKVANIMDEKPYAVPMGNIRKTSIPWHIFVGSLEGHTVTDNQALYDACIKAGSTDLGIDIIPGLGHEVGDMGNATSVKRDKFLAFINKYKGTGR